MNTHLSHSPCRLPGLSCQCTPAPPPPLAATDSAPLGTLITHQPPALPPSRCRFAKWRATIKVQPGGPSELAVSRNADELAQYAKICQVSREAVHVVCQAGWGVTVTPAVHCALTLFGSTYRCARRDGNAADERIVSTVISLSPPFPSPSPPPHSPSRTSPSPRLPHCVPPPSPSRSPFPSGCWPGAHRGTGNPD